MRMRFLDFSLPGESEAVRADLSGKVKQVMSIAYKARQKEGGIVQDKILMEYSFKSENFIVTFDRQGMMTEEKIYCNGGNEIKQFENGRHIHTVKYAYNDNSKIESTTTMIYGKDGKLLSHIMRDPNGNSKYKYVNTYDDEGKALVNFTYHGKDEVLHERTVWTYNKWGVRSSVIRYDKDDNILHQGLFKFDERGNEIEYLTEWFEERMKKFRKRMVRKFNEHNDCVETIVYDHKDMVEDTYSETHEYDSEGKKIITPREPFDPYEKKPGETEQLELDKFGNWIKKTTFYKNIPINQFVRVITYYDDPSENDPLPVHPLAELDKYTNDIHDNETEKMEALSLKQAQWLVESPGSSTDNFPYMRYYTLKFKEAPSLVNYTGPYIEAIALHRDLIENLDAFEVHSYSTIWNNYEEQMVRYTLGFRDKPYMLHATGISAHSEYDFDVPENVKERFIDDQVYFSSFQLLRPSKGSGKRDDYFEEQLNEYIELCSLAKKPDKPVINMIEVQGNGFAMVEHSVDDDFEISDLDLNYGYGFEKFHNELMERFYTGTKGLVLFHGLPGTGKTFYIRHLLRKMVSNRKIVIYMPPNMVDHLVEPAFMSFISSEVRDWSSEGYFCVLLIEDAEPLLAKRQEGVRIQGVTNLLNMTDGLLNDMLNIQIICTFNVDLKKLDSALLRPGRLIARKEFKPLSVLDANLLAQRLGIKHHFTKKASLGEIYALRKNSNTLIHDVEAEDDASTLMDDF